MVLRMAHAEHPLVAAHRAHAAPHLVRQRLKADALIHRRQRAGERVAGAAALLRGEKLFQRLFKPAVQQMFEPLERDHPRRACAAVCPADETGGLRKGKTAREPVRKDCRSGGGRPPVPRRRPAIPSRRAGANRVQRLVANLRVRRGDDLMSGLAMRVESSAAVRGCQLLFLRQQFHQPGEHFRRGRDCSKPAPVAR